MRDAARYEHILVDHPAQAIARITLNRPAKRNALKNQLRGELFDALERADADSAIRVIIIRGAGSSFSAGYDLTQDTAIDQPYYTAAGYGNWPRHVTEGCFRMWDLAKPVVAQIHGYCLAGGTELAAACDLVYVADDAKIGYPAVRSISPPDNQFFPWMLGMRRAMQIMLTGDAISGIDAVRFGFANRAFPSEQLEAEVLRMAARVALVPPDIQQINKRAVHRQMEMMGIRAGIRAGTELQFLGQLTDSARAFKASTQQGLTQALTERDSRFGDYRTSHET
ncbi:MAG TPA: enoyl-CoA hydratase-related protein [Steroidobacteraceae bacterium]|nr:enoyl-CoA hydratase-related protein [Steroidobacteraceae bacterium]